MARLFFALALVASLALAQGLVFPKQYKLVASMKLPYVGINEPITAYFDGIGGRQRMEYYNGLDTYIFRSDLNLTWQVNPVVDKKMCFLTNGPVDLASMLPDLSLFTLLPTPIYINGKACQNYQYEELVYDRLNTYNFYYDATTNTPIQYHMMGYDTLLGSHYDEYQIDYTSVEWGVTNWGTAFDQPMSQCGAFPGPGHTTVNPLDQLRPLFPSHRIVPGDSNDPFVQFMATYGKSYASKAEFSKRQAAFTHNWRFVHAAARDPKRTYTMRLNELADLTEKEMAARRGLFSRPRPSNTGATYTHRAPITNSSLPRSVDWREKGAVNPVKDQGICGSCWAFGTVGSLEGSYFIKYGKLVKLAEQELMDCSWTYGNNACDGGEDFRAYQWIIDNGGLASSEDYGEYLMADDFCRAKTTPNTVSLTGFVNVEPYSETALMDALFKQGPISVSIDASHLSLSFYDSGVYYEPECGSTPDDLDHSVLAVGYGTDGNGNDYWIVRNSWSTHWGDQGYVKMSRKNNNCGVATAPTYAILK